jgi:RNA polymerase sigma-70 factor (ECF subfamily)
MELSASQLWMSQTRSGPDEIAEIIARALTGDRAAFEAIVLLHERRVLTLAFRLLGNMEDAQDAAQEVFLRAFKYLRRFDSSKPLEPWLVRMTVNVCRGAGRKRSRSREVFVAGEGFQGEDPGKNPYAQLRAEEQKRFLYEALDGLAEKERTAIVLRDIEGLTTAEVAEILGSAEATVRSQISVARLKLRKAIVRMKGIKGGRDVL